MKNILEVFEKDTDAVGANRGFYYQYLYTMEEWLKLFASGDEKTKIYCEFEDDIRSENQGNISFKQVKCYKNELKFSSVKVKESIYNNFMLSLKYPFSDLRFVFATNQIAKDNIILEWEKFKAIDFKGCEESTVLEIKRNVIELCKERKKHKIENIQKRKTLSTEEKTSQVEQIEKLFEELIIKIEAFNWSAFGQQITFEYEGKQPETLKNELLDKISKNAISDLPVSLIFSRMLQEVVERSSFDDQENRVLTYETLSFIIKESEDQAKQKLKSCDSNAQTILQVFGLLSDLKEDTKKIQQGIAGLEQNDQAIKEMLTKILEKVDNQNISSSVVDKNSSVPEIIQPSDGSIEISGNITCDKLYEIVIEKIDKLIDEGQLASAQTIIEGLLESKECPLYPEKFIVDLKTKIGIVHINTGNLGEAEKLLNELVDSPVKSKAKFTFMVTMAGFLEDDSLLDRAVIGLLEVGVDQVEVTLARIKYDLHIHSYEHVIKRLTHNGQIKEEFNKNAKAFEFLGLAHLQIGDLGSALDCFSNANQIKESLYRKFLIIVCQVEPIISRVGSIFLLSQAEKDFLAEKYQELLDIEMFFRETKIEDYWRLRLAILLFIDIKEMEQEFNLIPEHFKQSDNIKLLMADRLSIMDDDKAYDALVEIYKKHEEPELLTKILTTLMVKKRFEDVFKLLDGVDYSKYDPEGRIAGIFIEAIGLNHGIEQALKKADEIANKFLTAPFLYLTLAKLHFQNNDLDNSRKNLMLMKDTIGESNYPPRLLMAEYCEQLGFLDLAIEVIEPLAEFSLKAKKYLVNYLIKSEDEKHFEKAASIIDDLIKSGIVDYEIYAQKSYLAYEKEQYDTALEYQKKSYELKKTPTVAYNLVLSMMNLDRMDGIDEVLHYLSSQNNPRIHMLLANVNKKLGKTALSDYHSIKALSLLGETIDEEIYSKFIALHLMANINEKELEELDKVLPDSAIRLVGVESNQEIWICIHSDKSLFNNGNDKFAGCLHYHINDKMGILLRNIKKGELVDVDDTIYRIVEIIPMKVQIVRYCMAVFSEKFPDSPYLKTIKIPEDDPISPILPFLTEMRERGNFLLKQYNFENGIGLPLYRVARSGYSSYPDTIVHIFQLENQVFYAGEVNPITIEENTKIVVTLSTLILLNMFGCLKNIDKLKDIIYVPTSLYSSLKAIFDQYQQMDMRTVGSMAVDDEGKPIYSPVTEQEKAKRLDFWREILLYLSDEKINIVQTQKEFYKENIHAKLNSFIGHVDFECICLAAQLNGYLVADDLFVRKACATISKEIVSTNIIALLQHSDVELNRFLDILVSLSKNLYHFLLSKELIMYLADKISENPVIFGEGTPLGKVQKIFRHILTSPVIFNSNLKMIVELLDQLYDLKGTKVHYELILIILNELIIAGENYKLTKAKFSDLILTYVRVNHRFDLPRENFFRDLFKLMSYKEL